MCKLCSVIAGLRRRSRRRPGEEGESTDGSITKAIHFHARQEEGHFNFIVASTEKNRERAQSQSLCLDFLIQLVSCCNLICYNLVLSTDK